MNPEDPNLVVKELFKDKKSTKVVGAVVVGLVITWIVGVFVWYQYNLRPLSAGTNAQLVIINPGKSVDMIADTLAQREVIRSATAFKVYVTLHGLRGRLQSGAFDLRPNQSSREIAKIITSGKTASQKLVVPEGFTISAIKARAATFGIKPEDFDAALQQDLTGTKAAQRPAGVSLEGYLYPDTYTVTPTTTAQQLVRAMVDNFDRKVTDDIVAGFAAQGLTLHQGVTLASMVEREVSKPADRKLVAGVFLNRLKINQRLESDPTTDYAAALKGVRFNLRLDSPYNTYVAPALPPGPICSPGLDAMRAVVSPTASDYYYFVSGRDGITHFAKTFPEHDANVQKYLR
jgi:UPF0755 protein